ncbi:hypothetical protein IFO70_34350 [Phormidium tenue FACHB-886]|nr:hypothetical protein [Phormidium tenue FACHB-886]
MELYSSPLPDGRWGIYQAGNLLATIGCPLACQKIVEALQQRQSKFASFDELVPAKSSR